MSKITDQEIDSINTKADSIFWAVNGINTCAEIASELTLFIEGSQTMEKGDPMEKFANAATVDALLNAIRGLSSVVSEHSEWIEDITNRKRN